MCHLDICNTSYDKKKGRESNWQFDSRPLKSGIDLISLRSGDLRHTVGKFSTRATTLLQTSLQSKVCTRSYAPSKLQESQLWEFRDSHLGVPGQKARLDVAPVESYRVYYMGEGGGFPRVWAVMSLVSPELPVACPSTKGALESGLTDWVVGLMQVQVSN
jgi:hypothetical protein